MRIQAQQYRDTLYRLKSHPSQPLPEGFSDKRDSFAGVYWSTLPFLGLEYLTEVSLDLVIAGLVFPTGFLLFWAFFYTYYRPGLLEDRLTSPGEFGIGTLFAVLFGVAIWFVKISAIGLLDVALSFFGLELPKRRRQSGTSSNVRKLRSGPAKTSAPPNWAEPKTPPPPPRPKVEPLPRELDFALSELGLHACRDWNQIHRRYRELAKKFHPDHNLDRERAAKYFIRVDSAYRTLSKNKSKYFAQK